MRICLISPFYDPWPASLLEVTGRYRHVEALSAALARRNHDVVVVQTFHQDRIENRNSVEFRYARTPQRSAARLAGGRFGVDFLMRSNLKHMIEVAMDAHPDAVHMFGLPLLEPLFEVGSWCAATGRPLTVSYHGGAPRWEPWLRGLQRRILQRCRAVFFTSVTHARPWLTAALLREEQVVTCMEVSSSFAPADRDQARTRTKMRGNPVFAWNARLHPIKDPLTVLRGFSLIRERWQDARLYMIYYTSEMEWQIRHAISSDPALTDAVELRGTIAPQGVEDFLNSADFLVQGSLQEVAGYSVLEAMSCGVIPIVTDIPSFRAMTAEGSCGILFPIGDYRSMAEQTLACDLRNLATLSQKVRDRFVHFLSYDAIARIYETALMPKTGSDHGAAASTFAPIGVR
jgi:glycosyltransferase involved in cell wall biosynthesis